jgi:phosphoglycolate phosphatase-like HAD superfamily hydrolase
MDKIRAVLLDVDGTLIDSNDAHAHAWVEAGRELGHPIEFERVRWLIGMGGDRVLPELTGLTEASDAGKRLLERRGEIFRTRYLPRLTTFPGALELLRRMGEDGLRLVVATSASQADMHALLAQGGIDELIADATNSDDAAASKPAPDIVTAALARARAPAGNALMLGDTPYDVEAASRAGVRCIALTCGGWSAEELHGAAEIYADPAALLAAYDRSLLTR